MKQEVEKLEEKSQSNPNPETKPMSASGRTEVVEVFTETLKAATQDVSAALLTLTEEERRRTYKPHMGVEAPAGILARLVANEPKFAARVPEVDAGEMLDEIELIAAYLRLRTDLARTLRAVDDSLMVVRNALYQEASLIHGQAQLIGQRYPEIVDPQDVSVFDEFLGRGISRPKPEDDPVVVEPVVPAVNGGDSQ